METFVTLILKDADPALAEAHDELYPERIPEQIPLSLTLLYPWIPRDALTEADIEGLREFFADRAAPRFDLTRLAEFPEAVVYAVYRAGGGAARDAARPLDALPRLPALR